MERRSSRLKAPGISDWGLVVTEQRIGWSALLSGNNGMRSLALAGGVALHAINVYVATTILPSVVAEIGGLDYYAWNTTLFIVASIIGSVLSAKLLAGLGPRGAYGVAAGLFGLGTFVCALAPSMPVLLLGRFVQGLGGGLLFALAYAMIRLVFTQTLWPRAMAIVSGMWGVATLAGPAIGGTFAELGSWRMAFWAVLPATALFAALALAILPGKSPGTGEGPRLAMPQLALLVLAVFAVSLGSINPKLAWNIASIAAALFLVAILVLIEGEGRDAPVASRCLPPVDAALHAVRHHLGTGHHSDHERDVHPAFPAGAAWADAAGRRLSHGHHVGGLDHGIDHELRASGPPRREGGADGAVRGIRRHGAAGAAHAPRKPGRMGHAGSALRRFRAGRRRGRHQLAACFDPYSASGPV